MPKTVRIMHREQVFSRNIFRIDEVTLQHERFDGSMSDPMTRLILNRGDSVAVLAHDPERKLVLLCEQFRAPAIEHEGGWLLELPAGMVSPGESDEDCARREALEEIGYSVTALDSIARVYLSPGGSSERIHIFHSTVSLSDQTAAGGGLVSEGEDIRLVALPVNEAIGKVKRGEIIDAKTLIALQWLARFFG
jgi:nudix-type nucleoside diphosphatase (YffH/AdpP family)